MATDSLFQSDRQTTKKARIVGNQESSPAKQGSKWDGMKRYAIYTGTSTGWDWNCYYFLAGTGMVIIAKPGPLFSQFEPCCRGFEWSAESHSLLGSDAGRLVLG